MEYNEEAKLRAFAMRCLKKEMYEKYGYDINVMFIPSNNWLIGNSSYVDETYTLCVYSNSLSDDVKHLESIDIKERYEIYLKTLERDKRINTILD